MPVTKLLKLCLTFPLVSIVVATSLTGCLTQANPTCGEVWTRCLANNKEQFCRDLLCETWRTMCDDCDICHNISRTSFPTPTPTPTTPSLTASVATVQGGCDGPQCTSVFSSCDSSLQWCRDLVCETNGYICSDCPICFDKSTTTFPPAAPETLSSTLSTVTLPSGSITITVSNPVWPTNPPSKSTAPPKVKRNTTDSPQEYCGFACGKSDCAYVCHDKPFYGVFISRAMLQAGGLITINLGKSDLCAEWACGPGGCWCGKYNGPKLEAIKRSPAPALQEVLDDGKDKKECGYACNADSCARICMTAEYVEAYKRFPHTIWVTEDTATSLFTITLPASQFCSKWTCEAPGCQCSKKPPTAKVAVQKRGNCWEQCDNDGHNCFIVCNASKQKRQCQQICSPSDHNCLSTCSDDPKQICFEVCDRSGKCETECSLAGQTEKRQCQQTCDKDGKNCRTDCKDEPKETCFEVCDKDGKCETECSVFGEAE